MSAAATADALSDRAEIAELINDYAYGIDLRDWRRYRAIFADPLTVDLAWSGVAETMAADAWVAMVCGNLAPFDATQHRMTNLAIALDGDRGTLRAQMTARHVLDGRSHLIGGYYAHDLVRTAAGWKITRLGLVISWEEGDRGLFEQAAARGPRPRADVGTQGMAYAPGGLDDA